MLSGAIAVTLRAPIAAMAVQETERVTNAIGAILSAPLSTSLAAVETERVDCTIGAVLSAPISTFSGVGETERVWHTILVTLRAPRSYSVGNTIPQAWRMVGKSRAASPRLHARHQRYSDMHRTRYAGQKQAFISAQGRRMGMDNATAFTWLSKCTAQQMIAAESAADLSTDWGDVS